MQRPLLDRCRAGASEPAAAFAQSGVSDPSRSGASAFAVAAGAEMDGEFVYQSQSGRQPGGAGSFEGELFFVPGSLKRPAGDEFAVRVERFELKGGDDAFVY